MISTETNIGRIGNHRLHISVSVPFVVSGANVRDGSFTSVASSGWSFQEAETPSGPPNFDFYVGSPVSGTLIVEQPNDLNSICYLTDINCQYRLAEVLAVAVEKQGDQFIASEQRRGWFGYGDSEERAIASFASSLVEELEGLSAREGQLSRHLEDELSQLRSVVVPRR